MAIVTGDFPNGGSGATVGAMIKSLFPQSRIERQWKNYYPFLSQLKKVDDFEGDIVHEPVEHDHPNVSNDYNKAKDNQKPTTSARWALVRAQLYGFAKFDAETLAATRSNKGGYLRLLEREIGNLQLAMQKRVAVNLARDSGGSIGQILSHADGSSEVTLTLHSQGDVANFNIGQVLVIGDDSVGTNLIDSDATLVVTAVSIADSTVTCSCTNNTRDAVVNDYYIFPEGDNSGGSYRTMMRGLADWIPLTAPSSTLFFGVDRSVNPERLAGHRLNEPTWLLKDCVEELAYRMQYTGAKAGSKWFCFMSPGNLRKLSQQMDIQVTRDAGGKAMAGFSGFCIPIAGLGDVEFRADPSFPDNRGYILDMASWELKHLKGFPHLIGEDSLNMLRATDADQFEVGYRLWGNMWCSRPGSNGVFAIGTSS